MMNWINVAVAVGGFVLAVGCSIVAIVLSWGKFGARLTVIESIILEIKDNHLKHIAEDVKDIREKVGLNREKIAVLESKTQQTN